MTVLWERFGGLSAPLNTFPSIADTGQWLRLALASSSVIDLVGTEDLCGPLFFQKLVMHCWIWCQGVQGEFLWLLKNSDLEGGLVPESMTNILQVSYLTALFFK